MRDGQGVSAQTYLLGFFYDLRQYGPSQQRLYDEFMTLLDRNKIGSSNPVIETDDGRNDDPAVVALGFQEN